MTECLRHSRRSRTPAGRCPASRAGALTTLTVALAMSFPLHADDLMLADPATGCKVWGGDDLAASNDVVSWSGACRDGLAHGPGVLSWFSQSDLTARYQGTMLAGRADGTGVLRYRLEDGFALTQGRFFEGLPHGPVAVRYANGDRFSGTVEHGLDKGSGSIGWLTAPSSRVRSATACSTGLSPPRARTERYSKASSRITNATAAW